ncbi:MAG: aspartate carbamoyltransferase [Oscillospiraceae bacterium]|nr:aspartate carbamoyltransferase [Oscillospiraceae bacterium]
MKHIISCNQFNKENLEELFELAKDIKKFPKKYLSSIDGKIIATLFYEPSTRTRLSFETAVQRVGGKIVSTENAKEASSVMKGESLEDTIRTVAGYADAIIIRHSDVNSSKIAASVSSIPVINAGAGKGEHPTQALLDMYTIKDKKGEMEGLKVCVSGDLTYGRTVHSLVKLLALYKDGTIYGVSSKYFKLPTEYLTYLEARNIKYVECSEFKELPKDVDVIYHTRTQLERIEDKSLEVKELIVNKSVLDNFSKDTLVMHPLPRVNEITVDVDEDPRAIYFEQAHNGMYVRMAILKMLLT